MNEIPKLSFYINQNTCYGCRLAGHMIKDYAIIKRKNERTRFKYERVDKRAMVGSHSDNPWDESDNEKIVNVCLMVRESSGRNDELEVVTLEYLLTFTKQYLAQAL